MLCSQVYHTDGLDGQLLFNYFQIRLHIVQGAGVRVLLVNDICSLL